MNHSVLASGDGNGTKSTSPRYEDIVQSTIHEAVISNEHETCNSDEIDPVITIESIDNNEVKLNQRIGQCKNIIESLKLQVTEEKEKLCERESLQVAKDLDNLSRYYHDPAAMEEYGNSSLYCDCIDSKLYCDENLYEYEKQLQKYQNTLDMAEHEKKNAIRKQMMEKAFKLKIMELESICNVELLRVKQNLQCLDSLQLIVDQWKTSSEENSYDTNNFNLLPIFPDFSAQSGSDVNSFKEEIDKNTSELFNFSDDDPTVLD